MVRKVSFEYNGSYYNGTLESVMGAGSNAVFHLYVNNRYYGRLRQANGKWIFDTTKASEGFEVLADYFGGLVKV